MPDSLDSPAQVSPEEFRALLKLAGLSVSGERAPAVLDELNAQLRQIRAIDDALGDAEAPAAAPFDPTFPKIDLEDEAE